ncbi:MAG: ARMT1-like domain-containing protein [Firmicutes bacterium]|nr:ARMT1-like domain-containing protein [Bacillota bacterium]
MEIFLDCLPCVLRQVLEASRMATDSQNIQEKIMEESIEILRDYKYYKNSPEMVKNMHQVVKNLTDLSDPYKKIKKRDIKFAKKIEPFLEHYLELKQNELYYALKISATGNIIDSAIYSNINSKKDIETEVGKDFSICDINVFQEKLKTAKNILILGDNAGETVFDRVLIKHLSVYEITYAVRNEPIINDATLEDAIESGLDKYATIISSGCGAPGVVLNQCNEEFLSIFNNADIVISKGQGNFEGLSDCQRPIFFLLKAKCNMIARKLNVTLNDYVFKYQRLELK